MAVSLPANKPDQGSFSTLAASGTARNIGKLFSSQRKVTSSILTVVKSPQRQNVPWHCLGQLAQAETVAVSTPTVKQCRCAGASDWIHALDHFSLLLRS